MTPVLLRWLHEDDLNELVSPHVGRRTRKARVRRGGAASGCHSTLATQSSRLLWRGCEHLLQVTRAAKQQRSSIAVLRDKPRPSFPQSASAPTRLVAWLLGWRCHQVPSSTRRRLTRLTVVSRSDPWSDRHDTRSMCHVHVVHVLHVQYASTIVVSSSTPSKSTLLECQMRQKGGLLYDTVIA